MITWYYAIGQDQKGPISEADLRALIKSGQLGRETLVWRDGMDSWQPADKSPGLADVFVMPPPLPAVPPPMPYVPLAPVVETAPTKTEVAITSRPWPRFWARLIDNFLLVPLFGFGIGLWAVLYSPGIYLRIVEMNGILFSVLILPVVTLFLALCMIVTGTTLGKAIVGVRVPVPANRGRIGFFLAREFKVWSAGLGLGIPFVALFTQVRQYRRLAAGQAATYDEGNPPVVADPSKFRLSAATVVVAALFLGNVVLRQEDQRATRNLVSTQTWINPVTKKSATIGQTWRATEMNTDSGRAFYFASDELLAEAILGYEQFQSAGVENAVYADAIKKAVASEITLNTQWTPVTVRGMAALRATGKSVKFDDSLVEVTIVVIGRDAWRTIVFARGNSTTQSSEKDKFVQAMFGTTN